MVIVITMMKDTYESWTEGNWCWLLLRVPDSSPSPSATAGELIGTGNETEPQPHDVVLLPKIKNTCTRSRVRSSSSSHRRRL